MTIQSALYSIGEAAGLLEPDIERSRANTRRLEEKRDAKVALHGQWCVHTDNLDRKLDKAARALGLIRKSLETGSIESDVGFMCAADNLLNDNTDEIKARLAGNLALEARIGEYEAEIFRQVVQPAKEALEKFERENRKALKGLPRPEKRPEPEMDGRPIPRNWFIPSPDGDRSPVSVAVAKQIALTKP